ncbi:oxidoreductase domain-containing protein [Caballeronia fortuita]|uniref:Oxidoreductase domain-containing protein n=1 Tax=Caballeronia fortuita TaxID=1777138 RepID=A0A158DYE7_9BURK|nr:Gfo/Idh/MocA family oxidoreductase [Caballeronia fortuita]SAK99216.1 oxidoreductase domain-containing protein [Caballeronia fortuita]
MRFRHDPTHCDSPTLAATTATTDEGAAPAENGRRSFLRRGGAGIAAALAAGTAVPALAAGPSNASSNQVRLPLIQDPDTEQKEETPDANLPPDDRIGYAIVGLGRLSLNQILPALAQCKYSKVTALVSGDRAKALRVARQCGVPEADVHDYQSFERLADNPRVQVVYIVLPNGMHKEYTLRAAKIGKHVLCEKPMANSAADCQAMIDAMKRANRKLMIAYRSQYEPMDRMIAKMVKDKKLGALREFIAGNSQNVGDPSQWRLKKSLAGGGAMPDIGLYCLNAARFLSGEEPREVVATVHRPEGDPRFVEVEESVQFILRFPSGLTATCMSSYASHESRFFRLQGAQGWVEMDPAFGYNGLRMRHGMLVDGKSATTEVQIDPQNQFAREIDHMSTCVSDDIVPHTPGEEGLQDQRIIEAIYESARTGRAVKLAQPGAPTRGADPQEETF